MRGTLKIKRSCDYCDAPVKHLCLCHGKVCEVSILCAGSPLSTLALAVVEEVEEEEQAAASLLASEATANHTGQDPGQSLSHTQCVTYGSAL